MGMNITKKQKLILFIIGSWYLEANKQFEDKILKVSISKTVFIDLATKSNLVSKKERAIYKNIETLEKHKLVSYENKELALTERGIKMFNQLNKELSPYLSILSIIKTKDPLSYSKKLQTVLKN
jgi:coproporphyrinogen III oxidase-like Fe-S oxidoreductase